jgi:excisionase family DNA binding protein
MRQAREMKRDSRQSDRREFYTVTQLADLLQFNEMTIYRMVKTGRLPCYLIGRIMRFRVDDIEEFLQQRRVPTRRKP